MRLLADAGIIRNRLKIDAAIENARRVAEMRSCHGGFKVWLDAHHPMHTDHCVKLFRQTFHLTGGEVTGEFLPSTGDLPGTHRNDCPAYVAAAAANPPWMQAPLGFWNER